MRCSSEIRLIHSSASRSRAAWLRGIRRRDDSYYRAGFEVSAISKRLG